jgi:hypothetical protein
VAVPLNDWCLLTVDENLSDATQDILSKAQGIQGKVYDVQLGVQDVQEGMQKVQLSIDASATSKVGIVCCMASNLTNWLASNTDNQHLNEEVQRLKTILSQLDEPIVRSATQLSDLHDSLERE